MKFNGDHPCPLCLVPKKLVRQLGTPRDMKIRTQKTTTRRFDKAMNEEVRRAKQFMISHRVRVQNKDVVQHLDKESLVPVEVSYLNSS